jgi:hypothetical protein
MRATLWSNITTGVWHQIAGYGNSTWFGCDFNHNNLWNAADLSEWSSYSGYQLNGTWAYFINDTSFGPLVITHKYWFSVHVSDGYAWKNQTFSFTDLYPGSGITISNPIPANGTSMYPGVTDWSVDIYSGGTVNWTIQCHSRNGSTVINSTGVNNLSGTKTAYDCHFFDYNRDYIIYVNATNSYNISQHSVFHLITQASASASLGTPNPANNSENISVAFTWSIPITKDVRDTLIDYTYTINCYNYLGALIGTHTENNINLSSKSAYIVFFGLLSNKTYTINISVLDYYGDLNHTLSITWVNRTYRFTTVDISDYTGWWDTNWKAKKRLSYDVSVSEASGLQVLINITKGAYSASDDLNVYPPRIVINSSNLGECRFVANYINHTTGHDGYTVLPVWVDVIKLPSGTSYLSQTKTLPFFTGKIQQGKALSWWYNQEWTRISPLIEYMHIWVKMPSSIVGDKWYNGSAGQIWIYYKNLAHLPYTDATGGILNITSSNAAWDNITYFIDGYSGANPFTTVEVGDNKVGTMMKPYASNGSGLNNTGRRMRLFQMTHAWDYTVDNHNNSIQLYLANSNTISPSEKLGVKVSMYDSYLPPLLDRYSNISGGSPYALAGDAHIYGGSWNYSVNKTGADVYSEGGDVLLTGGPTTTIWQQGRNYTSKDGDVHVDGTEAHMSHGTGYGKAFYTFDISPTIFQDDTSSYKSLLASIYYDEVGTVGDGPDIYVYKYTSPTGWKKWAGNVGGWPSGAPYAWSSDYSSPSPYNSQDFIYNVGGIGRIMVYVYSDGIDETHLGKVRLKYVVAGSEYIAILSEGSSYGYTTYDFDIGAAPPMSFDIGVNFADTGTIWHGGPDLYVYNWVGSSYNTVRLNMGEQDAFTWLWYSVGGTISQYVSTGAVGQPPAGHIRFKVFADTDDWTGGDYTWITDVGLRHTHGGTETHLSESSSWGYSMYNLSLSSSTVEEGLRVGVYYKELSLDGPDLYLYNFDTSLWVKIAGNLGGGDHSVSPVWTTITNSNAYVSNSGNMLVEIFCPDDFLFFGDSTQVQKISINYAETAGATPGTGVAKVALTCAAGGTTSVGSSFYMPMTDDPLNKNTYHFYDLIWYNNSASSKKLSLNIHDLTNNYLWRSGSDNEWDWNGNGTVDTDDGDYLLAHYGESGTPGWLACDCNYGHPFLGDGHIDYLDASSFAGSAPFGYHVLSSNINITTFNRFGLLMEITNKLFSLHSRNYGWTSPAHFINPLIVFGDELWTDNDAWYLWIPPVTDNIEFEYPYVAIGKYVWRADYTEPVITGTTTIELPYFWIPYPTSASTNVPINPVCHGYSIGGFGGNLKTEWYKSDVVFGWLLQQTNVTSPGYVSWQSNNFSVYHHSYTWKVIVTDSIGNTYTATYTFTTKDILIANFTYTIINNVTRQVQFYDTSYATIGIDYYNWLFAHSSSSNKQNPLYTFGSKGNWSVTLTIENMTTHRRASVTKYVDLTAPDQPETFIIDLDWSSFVPWMYIIICIAMIWITMQFFNRLWRKRK